MRILVSKPKNLEVPEFPESYVVLWDEAKVANEAYLFGLVRETNLVSAAYIRLVLAIRLIRSSKECDGLITGKLGEIYALIRALVPALGRKPLMVLDIEWNTEHGNFLRQTLSRLGHRLIARGSNILRTYSLCEGDRYAEYYGIDRSKFVFIPYCASLPSLPEEAEDDQTIFTGGHHGRDPQTLFKALGDFPAEIVVVAAQERWPHDCLSSNMTLTGVLPFLDFLQRMRRARLVVLSLKESRLQATGIRTYVYALSLGKCVVVNDPHGTRGYIEDGLTGAVLAPGDPKALRKRVEELYYDDSLRREIEGHALAWARQNATASACLERVSGVVNDLLSK